jgi:hypothetical protein
MYVCTYILLTNCLLLAMLTMLLLLLLLLITTLLDLINFAVFRPSYRQALLVGRIREVRCHQSKSPPSPNPAAPNKILPTAHS